MINPNGNQSAAYQSMIVLESKPFEFPNIDFRMNENLFGLTFGKF